MNKNRANSPVFLLAIILFPAEFIHVTKVTKHDIYH